MSRNPVLARWQSSCETPVSFITSVSLSFRIQQSDFHPTNFRKISYMEFLPCFLSQSDKNITHFTWRPPCIRGLPPWMTSIFCTVLLSVRYAVKPKKKNDICNWDRLCSLWSNRWGCRNSCASSMIDCKVPSIGVWDTSIINLPTCDISMEMRCKRCFHDNGELLQYVSKYWVTFSGRYLRI